MRAKHVSAMLGARRPMVPPVYGENLGQSPYLPITARCMAASLRPDSRRDLAGGVEAESRRGAVRRIRCSGLSRHEVRGLAEEHAPQLDVQPAVDPARVLDIAVVGQTALSAVDREKSTLRICARNQELGPFVAQESALRGVEEMSAAVGQPELVQAVIGGPLNNDPNDLDHRWPRGWPYRRDGL